MSGTRERAGSAPNLGQPRGHDNPTRPRSPSDGRIWVKRVLRVGPPQDQTNTAPQIQQPAVQPQPVNLAPPRVPGRVLMPPLPPRPAAMQQKVDQRLMSFDELAGKIGHRPHKDKLGGRWSMSKKYKGVEGAMGAAQTSLAAAAQTNLAGFGAAQRGPLEASMHGALDEVIAKAQGYKDSKPKRKKTKRGAMDDLIADATRTKQNLTANLDAVLADPGFPQVRGRLTLEQALDVKARGINFADCKFDDYGDYNLNAGASQENFGAGAVNTVAKLVHSDGQPRVFKPEPANDRDMKLAPKTIGIDPEAPHYGNRNIASGAVASLLGTDVIPGARFGQHNGQVGLLMDMAPGVTPVRKKKQPPFIAANDQFLQDKLQMNDHATLARVGYKQTGDGTWERYLDALQKPWTAPPTAQDQASLQSQLNALEWCDSMSGQMDRWAANYLVDMTSGSVKVTGIDNDFAFGKNQDKLEYDVAEGATSVGKPKLIDLKTLDKMKDADFDRDLRPALAGLLSPEEIQATQTRFNLTKQHALDLEQQGLVVDDWETWTSPDGLSAAEYLDAANGASMFKRDFARFFKEDGLLA